MKKENDNKIDRRQFFQNGARTAVIVGLGGLTVQAGNQLTAKDRVWQIDPNICVQCEQCAEKCVLSPSAVKCVHIYDMCGYCDLCSGYFEPARDALNTAAENQLCPTSAITRTFIEDPYFKYDIDEEKCIGCGKCVKGCGAFGNGSLQLQVRHDRCVNCNQCAIAIACPADAFKRVPADHPYLLRGYDI